MYMCTKRIIKKWIAMAAACLIAILSVSMAMPTVSANNLTIYTDNMRDIVIGEVEISYDELVENNYMVTVPVTMPENPGYVTMQFGVTWDTSRMTGLGARSTGDAQIPLFAFAIDRTFLWVSFVGMQCVTEELCSVTFQLDESAYIGDYFPVDGAYEDYNHNQAWYGDMDKRRNAVNIVSGGIRVVESTPAAADVQLPEVSTTKQTLSESGYTVDVPLTLNQNTGFHEMAFGVTWDPTQLTDVSLVTDSIPEGLTVQADLDAESGFGWLTITAKKTYRQQALCTLQFQVTESAKIGMVCPLEHCLRNSNDTAAYVKNIVGETGTLTLQDGKVSVKSNVTPSQFAMGSIVIPRMEMTLEELEAGGYELRVPIRLSENSSMYEMAFGISWNSGKMQLMECIPDDTTNLKLTTKTAPDQIWMQFTYQGDDTAYMGTDLCTLVFQLSEETVELGDTLSLVQMAQNLMGETPYMLGYTGTTGKLTVTDGEIVILTATEKNSPVIVKLPDITIDYDTLKTHKYKVELPLTMKKNTGFASLCFGVGWDTDIATPLQVLNLNTQHLGVQETAYTDSDMIWLNYIGVDPNTQYMYYDMSLSTLTLQLSEEVQPGDVIPIYAMRNTPDGTVSSRVYGGGITSVPVIENGSITITGETGDVSTDSGSIGNSSSVINDQTGNVLEESQIVLREGQQTTLYFDMQTSSQDTPVWMSKNPNIVQVNAQTEGKTAYLTAMKPGTTTVHVSYLGRTYSCEVTVLSGDLTIGDLNTDGEVNMQDIILISRYLMHDKTNCYVPNLKNGDMNADNCVNSADISLLAALLLDEGLYLIR